VRRAATVVLAAVVSAGVLAGCGGGDGGGEPKVALGRGGQLFVDRCGRCHTLSAAGTDGKVGPKLDALRPSAATVLTAIDNGPGVMPSGLVDGADAQAVVRFVAANAGR
jgi:mono/diheme cytochrome c family protein